MKVAIVLLAVLSMCAADSTLQNLLLDASSRLRGCYDAVTDYTNGTAEPRIRGRGRKRSKAYSSTVANRSAGSKRRKAHSGLTDCTVCSPLPKAASTIQPPVDYEKNMSSVQPYGDEVLVLEFHAQADPGLKDNYTLVTMHIHSADADETNIQPYTCSPLAEDSSVLRLTVPHTEGQVRNVRLQSDCMERVKRTPLNSSWPIDPSWVTSPMTFENPVEARNGQGTLTVTIDDATVATGAFTLDGHGSACWQMKLASKS